MRVMVVWVKRRMLTASVKDLQGCGSGHQESNDEELPGG
jgi:hypothetical protein